MTALVGGGIASLLMPLMPAIGSLALTSILLGAAVATTAAMVFSLLATEVPAERRSTTLNLVYLPLYIAGIIGPAIAGGLAAVAGPSAPFVLGGIVFLLGAMAIAVRQRSGAGPDAPSKPDEHRIRSGPESRGVPLS